MLRYIIKKVAFVGLLLLSFSGEAQQIHMTDLLHYLQSPVEIFDHSMLRQRFICYQSSRHVWGWTCSFAYQPTPLLVSPEKALAIIQYDRSSRSSVLVYQIRLAGQYRQFQKEIADLGYRQEAVYGDHCIFIRGTTVITCRQTDHYNGMSGNYTGHTITLVRRHS